MMAHTYNDSSLLTLFCVLPFLRELELLHEGRERQKVMVESIVKQRDMYRVLLAQSTLQPPDTATQVGRPCWLFLCMLPYTFAEN